jgi:PTH1 family peptidyl-tRNA hydrolase
MLKQEMKPKTKKLKLKHKDNSQIFIVAGLGNPGPAYVKTRHNVGFLCLDRLAEREGLSFKKVLFRPFEKLEISLGNSLFIFIKPLTFMNRSGQALWGLIRKYSLKPSQLIIVVDNMDLPPGVCRLKLKGSSAGHNGLKSIINETGSSDFIRLYIGVGRPEKGKSVIDHVLGEPTEKEKEAFDRGIKKAVDALYILSDLGPKESMNEINRKLS